jgi:hypothetical protein
VLALSAALLLAGCTGPATTPTPSATSSPSASASASPSPSSTEFMPEFVSLDFKDESDAIWTEVTNTDVTIDVYAWQDYALAAQTYLREADLGSMAEEEWNGELIIDFPVNSESFEYLTDKSAEVYQAATPCGPHEAIVVNPLMFQANEATIMPMLVHEGVHFITHSACFQPGPQWITEGFAEMITAEVLPEVADEDATALRKFLRDCPIPTTLPPDSGINCGSAFDGTVLAKVAVETILEELGREKGIAALQAAASTTEPDPADIEQWTTWYVETLESAKNQS